MVNNLLFIFALATIVFGSADKQVYLAHSDNFEEWDTLTQFPTLQNENFNTITIRDTLNYQFSPLLTEWDNLTAKNDSVADWYHFTAANMLTTEQKNNLNKWSHYSFIKTEYEAHSFNKWFMYRRKNDSFDIDAVKPWYPEEALSYIPFGSDVTASAAKNPIYTGRIELPLNIQNAVYSDRIALTPYKEIVDLDDPEVLSDFITVTLKNSFNIRDNDSPEETSEKIEKRLKHDVNIYSHLSYRPLLVSGDHANMEIRAYSDVSMRIPGDIFGVIFTGQLSPGGTVDVSNLQSKAVTALAVSGGGKSVRPVPNFLKPLLPSKKGLIKKIISLDLITGVAYAEVQATSGEIFIDETGAALSFHGEAELLSAGTGLHSKFEFENPFINGFTPAGYGASLDLGFEISDDKRAVALYLNNMGAMRWNNVQKSIIAMHVDSLDVEEIASGGSKANDLTDPRVDSLVDIGSLWRPVQTNFSVGIVQVLHSAPKRSAKSLYSRQLRVYGEYQQAVTPYPGASYIPRIKMGIDNDFLSGGIGAGYNIVLGGPEHLASGLNLRFFNGSSFTIDMAYSAYGTAILFPKRGVSISLVTQIFNKTDKWLR
jgi:hypothetical protein